MATMVPTCPEKGSQHSEEVVFKAFASGLPDDWLVIYSRRLLKLTNERSGAWQGEADFVIFHPRRGLVVLEVKGGIEVGRDRNGWYSVDHPNLPSISSNPAA